MSHSRSFLHATVRLFLCFATLVALAPSLQAAAPCTPRSLNGAYRFQDLWVNWKPSGAGQSTFSSKGRLTFDGSGGVLFDIVAREIDEFGTHTVFTISGLGTYSVDPDCRGRIIPPGGTGADVFLALGGKVFFLGEPAGANEMRSGTKWGQTLRSH